MKKLLIIAAMCAMPLCLFATANATNADVQAEAQAQAVENLLHIRITESPAYNGVYATVQITATYPVTVGVTFTIAYYDPDGNMHYGYTTMSPGSTYATYTTDVANSSDTWVQGNSDDPAYWFNYTYE